MALLTEGGQQESGMAINGNMPVTSHETALLISTQASTSVEELGEAVLGRTMGHHTSKGNQRLNCERRRELKQDPTQVPIVASPPVLAQVSRLWPLRQISYRPMLQKAPKEHPPARNSLVRKILMG
jgi:hypothetical protein